MDSIDSGYSVGVYDTTYSLITLSMVNPLVAQLLSVPTAKQARDCVEQLLATIYRLTGRNIIFVDLFDQCDQQTVELNAIWVVMGALLLKEDLHSYVLYVDAIDSMKLIDPIMLHNTVIESIAS